MGKSQSLQKHCINYLVVSIIGEMSVSSTGKMSTVKGFLKILQSVQFSSIGNSSSHDAIVPLICAKLKTAVLHNSTISLSVILEIYTIGENGYCPPHVKTQLPINQDGSFYLCQWCEFYRLENGLLVWPRGSSAELFPGY